MADTLTVPITGPLLDKVRAEAEARGLSPEDYVLQKLGTPADPYDDLSWDEDMRRLEEPGENIPMEEVFDKLRQRVADLRAARK